MKIISSKTEHITENPIPAVFVNMQDFTPHYETTIQYIDDLESRIRSVTGEGETEFQSQEEALNTLKHIFMAKVDNAYNAYMAENGAGTLDIA